MELFEILFYKIVPLYIPVAIGFWAGKRLNVGGNGIALLMMYFFMPIIVFKGVSESSITISLMTLPILVFILSTIFCLTFLKIGKKTWHDSQANVLALAAGTANCGYFGLPVAIALFDEQTVGVYIVTFMGMNFFESSVGFYIVARGQHTARDAFIKTTKLPVLYAFLLGIIFSLSNISTPPILDEFFINIRGTYIILGMMIIGLGISAMQKFEFGIRFVSLAFLAKFILWPVVIIAITMLDANFIGFFTTEMHKSLILLSIVPLAANTVAIATLLNTHPDKAATTVLLSTLVALIYVPLMAMWLLS